MYRRVGGRTPKGVFRGVRRGAGGLGRVFNSSLDVSKVSKVSKVHISLFLIDIFSYSDVSKLCQNSRPRVKSPAKSRSKR